MVSPRKSRRKSLCFSSTRTSTPARASNNPSIIPAGPPPAMQQLTCMREQPISDFGIRISFHPLELHILRGLFPHTKSEIRTPKSEILFSRLDSRFPVLSVTKLDQ